MPSTLDWIIACERQGLLTTADVRRFRQLAEITGEDFSPRVVLKWLATRDRISVDQAERILSGPPNLTPVDSIVRILGDNSPQPSPLELDEPGRTPDEMEEDTKELVPLDLESVGDVALPPRGAPAFADSVTVAKSVSVASSTPSTPSTDDSDSYSLQADPDFPRRLDEVLASPDVPSEPLPSLRSKPVEEPPTITIADRGLLIAATTTAIVVGLVLYLIWRAIT